ncbi:ATP-grasp domain-containing protein [Ancylobacter sp. IITR112]|uniref:ATP-grasp domain-containing protein n=1 Tax=Ancylobacter sp. IITR112 TaxID=3138073 RepID=UPI00352AEC13
MRDRSRPEGGFDVVLVGIAARGLAASARRAGLSAFVLDLFADEDTRALAARSVRLRRRDGLALDPDDLLAALSHHAEPHTPLVLGTGFEDAPDLVARLAARFRLAGSGAETLAALKEPFSFAKRLAALGIPHPGVFAGPPPEGVAALEKRIGGSGGNHVRPSARPRGPGWYLQERLEGRSVSALFLGNGTEARLLAFSEQWCAPAEDAPFRYGGCAGPFALEHRLVAEIHAALSRLTASVDLKGLASADLIIGPGAWHLIEINPRPGASLDIFDAPPLPPLLRLHLDACIGKLPDLPLLVPGAKVATRAAGLFYAPAAMEIRDALPAWAADRPAPGTRIAAGEPVCTVHATGRDLADARALLARRMDLLSRALSMASRAVAE